MIKSNDNANPFITRTDMMREIIAEKQECPNGGLTGHRLQKCWVDGTLRNVCENAADCEYCNGTKWNDIFQKQPTEAEVNEYLNLLMLKTENAERIKKTDMIQQKNGGNDAVLLTMSLDKEYKQIPRLINDIYATLRKSNYKWLDSGIATCEFYSSNGWNPHIHIVWQRKAETTIQPKEMKKTLYNKFLYKKYGTKKVEIDPAKKAKYQIYNLDFKLLPYESGVDYVSQVKQESKLENCKKDTIYRLENGLRHIEYLDEIYDGEIYQST